MDWRRRYAYGVCRGEVLEFVDGNRCVAEYLGKFERKLRGTWFEYARSLCMFFKWLRLKEGLSFAPESLLNEHLRRRASLEVNDRRWMSGLVLKFCRDNPDFKERSIGYRYTIFMAIKEFFDFHEAPLTSGKRLFGMKKRRKNSPKQFDVAMAKRILGALSQRERTICLCMLQSGQSIDGILNRLDFEYLRDEVESETMRIRLDFKERKGNDFEYFSFLSVDAIQELRKWFKLRDEWQKGKNDSGAVFVTRSGKPVTVDYFEVVFDRTLRRNGLKKNGFAVVSHMFRKLFKTESSPPERGVSCDYVEFMMGHASGIESVGGTYDRTPEIYANVVEKEYVKLEPYINVYTGKYSVVDDEKQKAMERAFELLSDPEVLAKLRKLKETPL